MALKTTTEIVNNFNETNTRNTYVKVSNIEGTKESILFTIQYLSEDKTILYKENKKSFIPDNEAGNYMLQAYEYLKTLEEFKDAEDY